MQPTDALDAAFDHRSDATLVALAADRIAAPRSAPADSFVLHAPLELLARCALLPYVDAASRQQARERIGDLVRSYVSVDPADFPARRRTFDRPVDAVGHLVEAMDAGDLDAADEAAAWLGTHLTPQALADAIADAIIGSLAAAAHAPIYLWLAPRVNPRRHLTGTLVRPLVRELARRPTAALQWIDQRDEFARDPSTATAADVAAALGAAPRLGEGPSNFIAPTMSRVDTPTLAPAHLGPVCGGSGDIAERSRAVTRTAAWSMLGEPTTHAPYGWSHALTMSQAAVGIAGSCTDPTRALAVAATYVFGFRASLAVGPLLESFEPDRFGGSLDDAFADGPDSAVSAAWHVPQESRSELVTQLATRAAVHPDAHLAKYVLACLDGMGDDPPAAQLYLAAAARLVGYWTVSSSA